jgi:hypothetical protein
MRSNTPSRTPRRRHPDFSFYAIFVAFTLLLVATALLVHASETKRWMAGIKSDANTRVRAGAVQASEVATYENACPPTKPVLVGFDGTGRAKCRAVSAQACPSGQYISAVDPATFEIHCSEAGGLMSCPSDSYITEFMWLGESRTSYSCFQRLNPFQAWKFEPSFGSGGTH